MFKIFEDLGVHLQVHLEDLSEDRIETIEEHSCLVLCVVLKQLGLSTIVESWLLQPFASLDVKLLDQLLIFLEYGAPHDEVQAVPQDMLQDSSSVHVRQILSVVHPRRRAQLI